MKSTGIWIIIIGIFIGQLLVYTWCRVQCTEIGYELSELTQKHEKLKKLKNNLKIEHARLKSPERIEKIAKYQLGLITPTSDQMILIP